MLLLYERAAKETPPLGVRSFVAKQRIGHPLGSDALLTLLSELGQPDSDSQLEKWKSGRARIEPTTFLHWNLLTYDHMTIVIWITANLQEPRVFKRISLKYFLYQYPKNYPQILISMSRPIHLLYRIFYSANIIVVKWTIYISIL